MILVNTSLIAFLYLAPTAPPQNVTELSITSVSINVCFDPPTLIDQNGIITSFNLTYFGSPFQTDSVTINILVEPTAYPLDETVCSNLTNLQQNNNYNITVIAINSRGPGPISQSIIVTTNEAGENITHILEYFQRIVCNTIVISDGRCLSKLE